MKKLGWYLFFLGLFVVLYFNVFYQLWSILASYLWSRAFDLYKFLGFRSNGVDWLISASEYLSELHALHSRISYSADLWFKMIAFVGLILALTSPAEESTRDNAATVGSPRKTKSYRLNNLSELNKPKSMLHWSVWTAIWLIICWVFFFHILI